MIAQEHVELFPWLMGICGGRPNEPGKFLRHLAEAAIRADPENYLILLPALLALYLKYPKYQDKGTYAEMTGEHRQCRICGCTEYNCRQCVKKTGSPCWWVEKDLCSACVPAGAGG